MTRDDAGPLPLAVVGCDFRVASTHWRNALLLDKAEREQLARALTRASGARGLVVLETCNRVEWILDAQQPAWAAELARAQMTKRWTTTDGPVPRPYMHVGEDAAAHLVRVALGMESFVLGEREIAGQLNRAMSAARRLGHASSLLGALQTTLGRAVKRVHRLTRFGATSRGVHGLAVDLLRARLGPPGAEPWHVAVLGMGEIGRKAATLAEREPHWRVTRANRTTGGTRWRGMAELLTDLQDVDALVVATGARSPVVQLDDASLRGRARGPLQVIDLGAPAQVTTRSDQVQLLGLDDLLSSEHRPFDDADLSRARELVTDAVAEFRAACHKQGVAQLLRGVWDHYDALTHDDLPALLNAQLGAEVDDATRARLQVALRDALRGYTRHVIDEIEQALDR